MDQNSVPDGDFDYGVLGPLEIRFAGAPVSVGMPRHRALVAALLIRPNAVVSTDYLVEMLWEDPPAGATELLYGRVAEVRRGMRAAAGRPVPDLETHAGGYLLRVADGALDAERFERLVDAGLRAAQAGEHRRAGELQREALALWRGPALADVAGQPGAQAAIARLEELRMRAVEARVDADLAEGRHEELIAELVALVAEHPLNERLWGQLMLARHRSGRLSEALATFDAARRELAEQLGTEPGPRLQRLHRQLLRPDLELTPDVPVPVAVLPRPLTTFIGRDSELAAVRRLLRMHRLVTVTGVGGAGKSRLALETGAGRAAWFVELAALTQPDLLADVVGDALGVLPHGTRPRLDAIVEHLHGVEGLLILDNCEHLLDAAAGLAERMLAACPGLRILTTSRERLGVTGEALLPLPGLPVPEAGATTAASAGRSPAVRLFVERATATDPGFALTDRTAAAVAAICRELDGLPLAIELAAARVNAFAVDELAARLGDRFQLLNSGSRTAEPRHRTLHAVVDWSYRLLDNDERRLFGWLSVFAGRFELAWAEELAADLHPPATTAGIVAALVDKSLLIQESGRYRMLETLRAYGIERLAEQRDLERARDRHAALVVEIADDPYHEFRGRSTWTQLVSVSMEQFRTAMEWSVARGDAETALRIAAALAPYWHESGQHLVGRRWLQLTLKGGGTVSPAVRARALSGLALLASFQGDLDVATAAGEEAADVFGEAGDVDRSAVVLRRRAAAEMFSGSLEGADALLIRAQQATANQPEARGAVLTERALVACLRVDWDAADRLSAEAHEILRDLDDADMLTFAMLVRAEVARNLAGPAAGAESLCAALRRIDGTGLIWNTLIALHFASLLFGDLGRPQREVVALSAAHELLRQPGGTLLEWFVKLHEKRLEWLRDTVGAERFDELALEGRTRPVIDLVDEVCQQLSPPNLHTT